MFTKETRLDDLPPKLRGPFEKWRRYHEKTLAEVFWPKVAKAGIDDCWPFMGGRTSNKNGFDYGLFYWRGHGKFKQSVAHRIAWMVTYGDIPDGLWVLHKCDNPPCCNPKHLFLGTHQDNMADCKRKGRNFKPVGELAGWHILTEPQVLEARAEYAKGDITHKQLAVIYGVTKPTMSSALRGKNWKHLPNPVRGGPDNISRKLSNSDIIEIRALRKLGWKQTNLARKFQVTQTCISKLLLGKSWAHVKGR